jgi:8-oxo-dGTP pyrophosphatase MutT (NUDIX family)
MIVLSPAELLDVPLSWPVTGTSVLGHGHIADFVQDEITTPEGSTIQREYLQHPGAVAVIALDAEERVALVRQYRHAVRHRLVEPPAGLLDVSGEDYLVGAQRELAEEVDLAADTWHVLVDLFSTPGIVGESIRIYLARDLSSTSAPDGFVREGEEADMDVVWAPLGDLVDAVLAGRLHNPSLVSGVLAAEAARSRGWSSLRAARSAWPAREALLAATAG